MLTDTASQAPRAADLGFVGVSPCAGYHLFLHKQSRIDLDTVKGLSPLGRTALGGKRGAKKKTFEIGRPSLGNGGEGEGVVVRGFLGYGLPSLSSETGGGTNSWRSFNTGGGGGMYLGRQRRMGGGRVNHTRNGAMSGNIVPYKKDGGKSPVKGKEGDERKPAQHITCHLVTSVNFSVQTAMRQVGAGRGGASRCGKE